jgi:hypothetical protein
VLVAEPASRVLTGIRRAHGADPAERAVCDRFSERDDRRTAPHRERDAELDGGAPARIDHRAPVRHRGRQRLLAQHVHALRRRRFGVAAMVDVRGRDDHGLARRQQAVERLVPSRAVLARSGLSTCGLLVVDPGELDLLERGQRAREAGRVHVRERDEADPQPAAHAGAFHSMTVPLSADSITARPSASERRPS